MANRTITATAIIKAKDETRGVFAAIAAQAKALGRTLSGTEARIGSAAHARGSLRAATRNRTDALASARGGGIVGGGGGMGGIATGALAARAAGVLGPAALAYGGAKAFTNFADAERAFVRIGNTAGATKEELATAMSDAKQLAFDTAQPFDKITEGMAALAAEGRSMKDIKDFIPSVAKTAQAAGAEVSDIAKTAGAVGSHLGVTAKEMQTAFDLMADGGKRGSFELKDMARYLPSLLPSAKALGIQGTKGLSDIVSLMQMVRKSAGTSEEAAASMNDIMQKMEIEETTKKFKKFGVDSTAAFAKARKEGRNVFDVLEEILQQATKGDLSKIPQLFGDKEAQRFARSLMQDGGRWRRESADMRRTAPGTIDRDIGPVVDSARGRLDQLSTAFDNASKSLGALIAIPATPFLKELADQAERIRKAWDTGELGKIGDRAANRLDAKKAKQLRDDADTRMREIESEIEKRRSGIDDMDRADAQPITGKIGRDERARRRSRERAQIERLQREKTDLQGRLDVMSEVNTRLGVIEQHRRSAGAASFLRPTAGAGGHLAPGSDYGVGPGRWGFGPGGSPVGVPEFGDGQGGRPVAHPLPPRRPAALGGSVISSSEDIRAAFGGKIEAVVSAPVTATLTGSATVEGSTKVEVTVTASSELISAAAAAKSASAALKGTLNANGPGSTGKSSPDAGSGGTGGAE